MKHLKKKSGFTLVELVIVIVVISILGLFAIERIFAVRVIAEQSSIKQLVGNIKSALGLKVSQLAVEGNLGKVAELDGTNPLLLLSQTPANYIGEREKTDELGVWYFSKKKNILIYNVRHHQGFSTSLEGIPRIRYKIVLIYDDRNKNKRFDLGYDGIAGLDLMSQEEYSWNVKSKMEK